MAQADFRFYAELNFFLPPSKKQVSFTHVFEGRSSIKDMIESLGVPHPEVDLLVVNGESVDFSYIVQDGDRINVYPVSVPRETTPTVSVRPTPLSAFRFVVAHIPHPQLSHTLTVVELTFRLAIYSTLSIFTYPRYAQIHGCDTLYIVVAECGL